MLTGSLVPQEVPAGPSRPGEVIRHQYLHIK